MVLYGFSGLEAFIGSKKNLWDLTDFRHSMWVLGFLWCLGGFEEVLLGISVMRVPYLHDVRKWLQIK